MCVCVVVWRFRRYFLFIIFFFFQAEDGIRDTSVTGVQTCALPILLPPASGEPTARGVGGVPSRGPGDRLDRRGVAPVCRIPIDRKSVVLGKECRAGWGADG